MARQKSLKTIFNQSNTKTAHFDLYKTNNTNNPISLTVQPGDNGQSAVSDANLDGASLFKGTVGTITNFQLGTNTNLEGKFLEVYTLITDTSQETDLTSFDFSLQGGVAPYKYSMQKTLQSQGASIVYKVTIFFTQNA
ncbi:hypothetical protein [Paraflavitalea speifideaquila]|uniref:hypothetical protein n=1 Tax=Paraflavitalea speifideaquila TaxID=3076558 RepID=UPI0028EDA3D3|nr:hypothetical protein [Paraflavitalea speifideiaquila]